MCTECGIGVGIVNDILDRFAHKAWAASDKDDFAHILWVVVHGSGREEEGIWGVIVVTVKYGAAFHVASVFPPRPTKDFPDPRRPSLCTAQVPQSVLLESLMLRMGIEGKGTYTYLYQWKLEY